MKHQPGSLEREYCIGCGLCQSCFGIGKATVALNTKGFFEPEFRLNQEEYAALRQFCPVDVAPECYSEKVWGERAFVCLGHAADETVRQKASSGGILTALCVWLLEQGMADGIIQVGDSDQALRKTTRISRSREQVLSCAGSRYIAALPLERTVQMLEEHPKERFAIVGRPCDIRGIKAYLKTHTVFSGQVVCLLSFFCAGTPSVNASKRMIEKMGAADGNITHISYRGNGWPGYSTVKDDRGNTFTMNYEDSWGKILGRDIYRGCRFCYDGIGEAADIACGDAWYLDDKGNVTFDERPGRNVIFARTEKGAALLRQAEAAGCIVCQEFQEPELNRMQPFQYVRKAQLRYKLLAMRTAGRPIPAVDSSKLKKHSKLLSRQERAKMYLGTLRRVWKKKI